MIVAYYQGDTALHRLNPLAKLSAVLAGCTAVFLFGNVALVLGSLAGVIAVAYASDAGRVMDVMRSRFAVMLGLWLIAINALFTPAGRVLVTVPFYFFYLSITDAGLIMGVLYAARFLTVFLISALFVASTEPAALVYALMRRGLPYRYGFLLVLMLRFVPVFERERKMVSDAQKMRGLEIDKRGVRSMYRSLRYTVVPLIVSALQKTESLVMSMEGRAFGYRPDRTFTFEDHFGARDLVVTAVSWAVFALALVGRFSGWRLLNGATF